jgi:hypothetical protein
MLLMLFVFMLLLLLLWCVFTCARRAAVCITSSSVCM